jgi:Family of unknown function (DUF6318)
VQKLIMAAVAAGSLVVAACSGDSHAQTPPSSHSPSASSHVPSPTPSRTGPLPTGPGVRPGETPPLPNSLALEHSEAGALQFAAYYVQTLDWSFATTDSYLLKRVSATSCKACARYEKSLDDLRSSGGYVSGGRFRMTTALLVPNSSRIASEYVVQVVLVQQPVTIHRLSASPSAVTARAQTTTSRVYVSWIGTGWRVVEEGGQ